MVISNQILVICRNKFSQCSALSSWRQSPLSFLICHVCDRCVSDANRLSDDILLDVQSIWPLDFWALEKCGLLSECLTWKSHLGSWRMQWLSIFLTLASNSGCPSSGSSLWPMCVPSSGLTTSHLYLGSRSLCSVLNSVQSLLSWNIHLLWWSVLFQWWDTSPCPTSALKSTISWTRCSGFGGKTERGRVHTRVRWNWKGGVVEHYYNYGKCVTYVYAALLL